MCATDALGNEGSIATTTATPAEASGDAGTLSINDGAYWTRSRVVELEMSAGIEGAARCACRTLRRARGAEDSGSGMDSVVVVMQSGLIAPKNCSNGEEIYRGSGQSTVITGLVNRENYAVRVCAIDHAGNESKGSTALLAPTGNSQPSGSIVLNGGDIWTADRVVTVDIESRSATQVCLSHTTRCSRWRAIPSSTTYTVPAKPGEAVVYATFRDGAGNLSPMVSDAIQFDNGAPGDQTSRW